MKILLMVILLVFLCCFTVSCQQGEELATVDVEADVQAIKDIAADANMAINAADIDWIVSFYADDAVRIPPKGPIAIGKEAIRSRVQELFEEYTIQENDVVKDVKISGNLAVAHVIFSGIVTPKSGGEPTEGKGNCIWVFRREPNDAWTCIYSIWTSDSLIYQTQAE
jgi:uncharacterized protein (TIGR02246 family)